jgi:hypothetical protein
MQLLITQFGLLHHSHTSPLVALANTDLTRAEAVIRGQIPGTEDLTVVDISDDMLTVCTAQVASLALTPSMASTYELMDRPSTLYRARPSSTPFSTLQTLQTPSPSAPLLSLASLRLYLPRRAGSGANK